MAKKKRLPEDFRDMLLTGDLPALKAVFETCDVDARGGYSKVTALAFSECSDELTAWLVARGADIAAEDSYGETPLHARARDRRGRLDILLRLGADVHHGEGRRRGTPLHCAAGAHFAEHARVLLTHGSRVDALDDASLTPLEHGLLRCSNATIARMAALAQLLLDAGARKTPRMREHVKRIGGDFEFHRSNFNRDSVAATSAALEQLYALFDVPLVPARAMHDGTSPIRAKAAPWKEQHQELWALLVPSSGAAATVQGEVVRIAGKIARELDGNGGINWNDEFRAMADAWLAHVGSGHLLPPGDLDEARRIVASVKRKGGDIARMCELAVAWVARNPQPVPLPPPSYRL